ncbi:rubredoxin [Candidatus Magnetominusculus xianensis]|uniref:Rubredoxin n=1 Tax=Candidatus Magnetominusculus xianensis TaxID=1748249 RepID=A0ABR5SEC0_9BACT|nr:rubredoxin [Candidatus Magnetominusculus xianensis]KWT79622.1 rubredoxin [Candidatus Magnetominusculus xianensis]MBF0403836.1 rubredoxin [Nitrospirota bacterium]
MPDTEEKEEREAHREYVCGLCGYIYNPAKGDKKQGIPKGVPFGELPEDWVCPLCGVGKARFSPML